MYRLTFANGAVIDSLGLNGTNFVSTERVDENIFLDNLSTITVYNTETQEETVMRNAVFLNQFEYEGKWLFAFREMSNDELREIQLNAKIEYLAMMTGVDMEV